MNDLRWVKSSFSSSGNCVEVAILPDGEGVALRDSKSPGRQPHYFGWGEWQAFLDGVRAGEFDLP